EKEFRPVEVVGEETPDRNIVKQRLAWLVVIYPFRQESCCAQSGQQIHPHLWLREDFQMFIQEAVRVIVWIGIVEFDTFIPNILIMITLGGESRKQILCAAVLSLQDARRREDISEIRL